MKRNRKRIVFLTSSPTGPLDRSRVTEGLDEKNRFAENLKQCWKSYSRCLMITASPEEYEQNDEMVEFFRSTIKKAGLSYEAFDLWDGRTEEFSVERLLRYDVIFLGGGHVPTQNEFFRRIDLKEKMQDFSGIVIGISAGTMNSAEMVYAQPELEGEAADPDYQRFFIGLGLTRTMILPHYQMVKDQVLDGKRLYEDITYGDSFDKRFLALPDGSYLLIRNGEETVWGEAYEISDGKISKICGDGENKIWTKQ